MKLRALAFRLIRIWRREDGTSAIEFAMVLPILVLLVFGIIYFGLIFNNYLVLTHATREGIRRASLHADGAETETAIRTSAGALVQDDLEIDIDPYDERPDGGTVTVTLRYPVRVDVPVISNILKLSPSWDSDRNSLWLNTAATMRIE